MESKATYSNSSPMTREELVRLLKRSGVRPGTFTWPEYERGKRVIYDNAIEISNYDEVVNWIAEYVGV